MKLYYAPGTAALAVHILLEEIGCEFELERLNFKVGDQNSDTYLGVNPKGRVPALVTDQGILTETPAILAYLCQIHPGAGLAPADPFGFAQAQALNTYLASTVHVAHAHGPRGTRWADDAAAIAAMKAKVPENMGAAMRYIAASAFAGPWVLGETYSMCDAYLYTVTRWLEGDGVDPADHPVIADHRARVEARPAVQRALEVQFPGKG